MLNDSAWTGGTWALHPHFQTHATNKPHLPHDTTSTHSPQGALTNLSGAPCVPGSVSKMSPGLEETPDSTRDWRGLSYGLEVPEFIHDSAKGGVPSRV